MLHSLMLFLAPSVAAVRATESSPPAVACPPATRTRALAARLGFGLRVVADAIGFAILFAGCWLLLQLLQAAL